ncbi:MAG: helix-hairpin-helix domain-containing protein [Pirellulales bacterium]|nr:helix-hairpin-helix domain-containing protein [Pirellulales bacterium]
MNPSPQQPPPNNFLQPRDQRTVGILAAGILAVLAAVWVRHGGNRGGIIEIDRAPPLTAKFQVDVNRAEWPEFIQLPGIGPTLAQRLVEEREANGAFRELEDLSRVGGIGPRTLERIRPYLLPIPDEGEFVGR